MAKVNTYRQRFFDRQVQRKEKNNTKVVVYIKSTYQNLKKMTTKFIPIWEYCKKNNIKKQNIYRWIRERKIPQDKIKKIEKVVERIYIDSSFKK